MDEITLDDKTYVSSKRAAEITGYAKDYVGQLCREGRVEARLVGRNWYVLESSIREHRFGVDPKLGAKERVLESPTAENSSKSQESSEYTAEEPVENLWGASNYTPDTSPLIPTFNSRVRQPEINVLDKYSEFEEAVTSSSAVQDMQSAWHDWFVRTNELEVSKEILLEEHREQALEASKIPPVAPIRAAVDEDDAISTDDSHQQAPHIDEESTPITLEKVSEVIENQFAVSRDSFGTQETVPLHRSAAVAPQKSPTRSSSSSYSRGELRRHAYAQVRRQEEGRVLSERHIVRRQKKGASPVLRAIFLAVAVLAVLVSIVASGKVNVLMAGQNLNYAPVRYLVGESTYTKTQ